MTSFQTLCPSLKHISTVLDHAALLLNTVLSQFRTSESVLVSEVPHREAEFLFLRTLATTDFFSKFQELREQYFPDQNYIDPDILSMQLSMIGAIQKSWALTERKLTLSKSPGKITAANNKVRANMASRNLPAIYADASVYLAGNTWTMDEVHPVIKAHSTAMTSGDQYLKSMIRDIYLESKDANCRTKDNLEGSLSRVNADIEFFDKVLDKIPKPKVDPAQGPDTSGWQSVGAGAGVEE